MSKPTEADLNALDITPAEAAEINAIAHPLLAGAAPDADNNLVRIESTADGVVFVTINRPEKRNAFDAATIAALYEAFETLQGASGVRVVFLRGAGGHFCAGADLAEMKIALANWTELPREGEEGVADEEALPEVHVERCDLVALVGVDVAGPGCGIPREEAEDAGEAKTRGGSS